MALGSGSLSLTPTFIIEPIFDRVEPVSTLFFCEKNVDNSYFCAKILLIYLKTMPKPSKGKRQSERGAVKAPCEQNFASHLVRRPGGPGRVLPLQSV